MDRDHFSHHQDAPTEAFGWIEEMEKREDGIWGKVRWTSLGLEQIEGGVYRLVSPVFSDLEWLEGPRARARAIVRVALTNDPNMKGMAPVSNREIPVDTRARLCRILGIEESADDRALNSALDEWETDQKKKEATMTPEETEKMNRLENSVKDLTKSVADLTAENSNLKAAATTALNRGVAAALTEFKDEIGEKVEVWKNRLTSDLDGTREILGELRAAKAEPKRAIGDPKNRDHRPQHNPQNGRTPENQDADVAASTEREAERARKVGIMAQDIVNRSGGKKTRAMAFREADALVPKVGEEVGAAA